MIKVEGRGGNVLWLKVTDEEVKKSYERNALPDPTRYFVKEYPPITLRHTPSLQ
jgi:hypothetical protein